MIYSVIDVRRDILLSKWLAEWFGSIMFFMVMDPSKKPCSLGPYSGLKQATITYSPPGGRMFLPPDQQNDPQREHK